MTAPIQLSLTIPFETAGQRLDQVLSELLSEYSRTRIKSWIESGEILVNGAQLRPKDKVIGGERVEVNATLPEAVPVAPEVIDLDIAYQDRHLLVINKQAGLVV